ncbi:MULTISPECIES: MarR family winged helix-turn-helix transcriptional regulator [Gordonia]|jgi:DNA-binding MarR family transcriptional regulator|uniref:Putative MarR family transcriptional regulator n=1 Tax=Gordonia malaquae NBRC 108250 TaxID=1223542 RepID=M3UMY3_GORML|nr:MarR family transcriptional regulator [Gordonia malaquae]GAC81335.1 putative MarR family transcriptional regulator [Gordonia malaquae NBRC 108250]SEC06336.1 DNA-binding transcriptional regulator, MarR family [Gordonia malaquae]
MSDAWRLFIENSARLQTELDERLRASDDMTLSDYHVLLLLSEAPESRLRMRDLSQRMVFSASRLSYQVRVLADRGWLCREPVPGDRRGSYACLTDAGVAAFTAAARRHSADVDELFHSALSDDDEAALARVMRLVADASTKDDPT